MLGVGVKISRRKVRREFLGRGVPRSVRELLRREVRPHQLVRAVVRRERQLVHRVRQGP